MAAKFATIFRCFEASAPAADNSSRFRVLLPASGAQSGRSGSVLPSTEPIAGVDESNEHDLRFRNIIYINRFESQDYSDSSDIWFTARDIDYKVKFIGNLFSNVLGHDYEDGWVQGAVMGSDHEHMVGTVKRTDMIGAFGGSRGTETSEQ